jgi:hypothetical protein
MFSLPDFQEGPDHAPHLLWQEPWRFDLELD